MILCNSNVKQLTSLGWKIRFSKIRYSSRPASAHKLLFPQFQNCHTYLHVINNFENNWCSSKVMEVVKCMSSSMSCI